ncbi:zinc finger protein SHOOT GRAVITROPISM 5 [Eucalyptus grandis]|uniref:zinc finger protein SHOOT GRAVITROPISM 5 n=1 Tax=Eucalyptus grandis TaxID=71139 RepID=UPI00192E9180|nr:zinc finger protein SHOOT GRAVITROPISM 5 [Eucalyptus grandis]
MFHNSPPPNSPPSNAACSAVNPPEINAFSNSKRRRRPAGTPDPDAEVVSLSPKTLLESDRYVCEICNQGFQRDQNLQMHRRRHKVPWKLLKRDRGAADQEQARRKRVYVCPEPSCLHHDPCHALGDLVGIKKHFRRKHSSHKQWVCERCSKGYAVQSDYKAHLKTCGTRGHSCDCGRVFSRVESFIEHQDSCTVRRAQPPEMQAAQPACSSQTASSTSPSSEANFGVPLSSFPGFRMPKPAEILFLNSDMYNPSTPSTHHNLELQLLPSSSLCGTRNLKENFADNLKLSIGTLSTDVNRDELAFTKRSSTMWDHYYGREPEMSEAASMREFASEQIKLAVAEKAFAEEARQQAKRQVEIAELELANAKKMRLQAQAELERAQLLREQATKKISSTIMQITCPACKRQFQTTSVGAAACDETSLAISYVSSATTEGEGE